MLTRQGIDYLEQLTEKIRFIFILAQKSGDSGNTDLVQTIINDLETSLIRNRQSLDQVEKSYANVTKMPPPARMEDFPAMIAALNVPPSPEQAIEVGAQKNPQVQQMNFELETAQYESEAQRARTEGLSVDLSVGKNLNQTDFLGINSNSRGTSATLTFSWSLGFGNFARNDAAQKRVEAARSRRQHYLDQIRFKMETLYPQKETQEGLVKMYQEHYAQATQALSSAIGQLERAPMGEFKQTLQQTLSFVDRESRAFSEVLNGQEKLLSLKFSTLQEIGTLFDDFNVEKTTVDPDLVRIYSGQDKSQ